MKANVMVAPPGLKVRKGNRRMSPSNNTSVVNRPVPSRNNSKDIVSVLEDSGSVLDCIYCDQDAIFARVFNGYGQRVYVLVDQSNVNVDNKVYHKRCSIQKNAMHTEKSFEQYASLCGDSSIGCAVEHEYKIFIALNNSTYLITTDEYVSIPAYYPAVGIHKFITPEWVNKYTSSVYCNMRSKDIDRNIEMLQLMCDKAYAIGKRIDDIGSSYSDIVTTVYNESTENMKKRNRLREKGEKSKCIEVVSKLKSQYEMLIDVSSLTDIGDMQADLESIAERLEGIANRLSNYMSEL